MVRNKQKDLEYKSDMSMEDYKNFIKQEIGYGFSDFLVAQRYPKPRSIEYLHDLFLRAYERVQKKRQIRRDLIDEIVTNLDPVPGKEDQWLIMYNCDKSEQGYRMVRFSTHRYYGEKSIAWGYEYRSNDNLREENLRVLTASDEVWEYGERFHEVDKATNSELLLVWVQERLDKQVIEKLKEDESCKKFNSHLESSLILELGGLEYAVRLDMDSYPYYKIDWRGGSVTRIKIG